MTISTWMTKGKFNLNSSGLVSYSHGEYFELGKKLGSFGYSVKKPVKKARNARKRQEELQDETQYYHDRNAVLG